jgi:hypothetical protein
MKTRKPPTKAQAPPPELAPHDPPQKRSDKETNRVLAILDELERGSK